VVPDSRESLPSLLLDLFALTSQTAALVACGKPNAVGTLYSYLITQPEYSTSAQRQHLVRRMREALAECCFLCGVPVSMLGVAAIAVVEREEDKDYSFSR
jgi:hypothetical protein